MNITYIKALLAIFILSISISSYANISVDVTPATGPNIPNGSIDLTVSGGFNPYQYLWTDEAGDPVSFEEDIQNLLSGFYYITVTDALCGEATLEVEVGYECELTISTITPICVCEYGGAEYEVSGGNGYYNYLWESIGEQFTITHNEPNPEFVGYGMVAELPHTYILTVTDIETGCQASSSMEIDRCDGPGLASFIEVAPDCNEEGTSTISVELPPGTAIGPYEFRWIKAGVGVVEFDPSNDGTATLENAEPGEYCLSLRTLNGCDESVCGIIVESRPVPVIDNYTVMPSNNDDGAISIDMAGQQGPFKFLWNTGGTTANINNLALGNYCVTVTNNESGCTATKCIELVSCSTLEQALSFPFEIEAQVTPISSNGALGAIDILNVGDQFPGYGFSYVWSNGRTEEDIDNLTNGHYFVTISSNDCNLTITGHWEVCGFSVGFDVFPFYPVSCSNADLRVNVSPPDNYSFLWDDPSGSTGSNISAQYGVQYCVTISIGNAPSNCDATACITPEPLPLEVELVNLQHASYGFPTGSIEVTCDIGPFSPLFDLTYKWSDGTIGEVNSGLPPGTYTVTVTDDCGNTGTGTYMIQCELLSSEISADITDVTCSNSTGGGY